MNGPIRTAPVRAVGVQTPSSPSPPIGSSNPPHPIVPPQKPFSGAQRRSVLRQRKRVKGPYQPGYNTLLPPEFAFNSLLPFIVSPSFLLSSFFPPPHLASFFSSSPLPLFFQALPLLWRGRVKKGQKKGGRGRRGSKRAREEQEGKKEGQKSEKINLLTRLSTSFSPPGSLSGSLAHTLFLLPLFICSFYSSPWQCS